ncbi:MAG: spore coat protein U domain-containing protein [Methylotenera sp.]
MKLNLFKITIALLLLLLAPWAHATINCTISSTGFSTTYVPTSVSPNINQGSFTLICTKDLLDSGTTDYTVTINNGANPTGIQNRATLSANTISYDTYQTSGCSAVWGNGAGESITGSMNSNSNKTVNYWGCITVLGQYVPAGTYSDTVTMTVSYTNTGVLSGPTPRTATNTFPVSIINPAVCSITSIDNVAFGTYVAFRATALVAPNSNIVLNCTPSLSYNLALDANSGVVAGLNYSLSLSATTSLGSGPGQTHTIAGTMPANQAGTCATGSCSNSDPRTLTITY